MDLCDTFLFVRGRLAQGSREACALREVCASEAFAISSSVLRLRSCRPVRQLHRRAIRDRVATVLQNFLQTCCYRAPQSIPCSLLASWCLAASRAISHVKRVGETLVPAHCLRHEGWERFVVACSFLVCIASPLNWFYTPKLRCQLLYELDATRRDRYHGRHMRIVHAWLRVALHACRERFWARFWRVYERHSS